MNLTFTGRDLDLTDEIRRSAEHKMARIERMEPRVTAIHLELIGEHHPTYDGVKRVEAAVHIPRRTFRAHAEADDVPTALDRVREKLERQLRDHHSKRRRWPHRRRLDSAEAEAPAEE